MSLFQAFVGGFYQALSPIAGADTAVNLYTESRSVPGSAKQVAMYGTPGLRLATTVGSGRNRGEFTQDGRTWTVIGSHLYERIDATNYTDLGTIADDGKDVTFACNGRAGEQLAVCGGSQIYVLDLLTSALTTAALPFTNPVMITFIDGYGLANEKDSPTTWFSNLEDFEIWDALDFFVRNNTSDNVVGIAVSQDRVHVFGSKNKNMFYNSGDTDTPFVPYPGTTVQIGLAAPSLLGVYNDILFWVADSARGQRRVVMENNGSPQTISTPPIAQFLSACTSLEDGYLLVYEQDEHTFMVMTLPSSPDDIKTYHFDLSEQLWAARAGWDSRLGQYTQWRAKSVTAIDGAIQVGDYANGNIYELDLETYTDNGAVIRRERTTPYLSAECQYFFVHQAQLLIQAGVGLTTGQGSEPVANLEISRDGAQTWVDCGAGTLGAIGKYLARCKWNRLGRFIQNLCVLRVTQTDPVKTVWLGMDLRVEEGSGQL